VLELNPAIGSVSIIFFYEIVALARKNFLVSVLTSEADWVCLDLGKVKKSELEKYFSWEL